MLKGTFTASLVYAFQISRHVHLIHLHPRKRVNWNLCRRLARIYRLKTNLSSGCELNLIGVLQCQLKWPLDRLLLYLIPLSRFWIVWVLRYPRRCTNRLHRPMLGVSVMPYEWRRRWQQRMLRLSRNFRFIWSYMWFPLAPFRSKMFYQWNGFAHSCFL